MQSGNTVNGLSASQKKNVNVIFIFYLSSFLVQKVYEFDFVQCNFRTLTPVFGQI
jgi:hypothetical protein